MYEMKEETVGILRKYKLGIVAKEIGINYDNLSKLMKHKKTCIKLTAYAITKFLNPEKEILDYFNENEE